ncbi:hypothetical protein [Methylomonas albis]|uniref:Uncharacterized protein n=1 Tax=Methylomonas albis TaxID=1854563 RepID=A0ABR9D177_9GAMM|nr:hypothetical protein [Methylomonas albis]MBD9355974.1 hypothetical protein [Methylomonas albis]
MSLLNKAKFIASTFLGIEQLKSIRRVSAAVVSNGRTVALNFHAHAESR